MVGRESLYTSEPFRPSGSFEPNVINPLNQFDKEAYLYIIAFKKDTLLGYFIVDVNIPVRASLSSKEEPCPLRPHRGFLIPCPLPLINIILHVYHGF